MRYEEIYKPKVNEYLNDLNIIDISCGTSHALVLTTSGDTYAWGWNGSGNWYQPNPIKI